MPGVDANLHWLSPARTRRPRWCVSSARERAGAMVASGGAGRGGGRRFIRARTASGALRPGVLSRAFKQPVDMSSDGELELSASGLTTVSRNQGAS